MPNKAKTLPTTLKGGGAVKSAAAPAITLFSVAPNRVNSLYLDLVGDESIGKYCKPLTSGATPGTGPSTCQCLFQYQVTGSSVPQTKVVDTVIYETYMARCAHDSSVGGLPANADSKTVFVQLRAGANLSRALPFDKNNSGAVINTSARDAYSKVQRFQCREYLNIPYMFDGRNVRTSGGMYDPIQSDDTALTYGLNFYTANPGKTVLYLAMQSGGDRGTQEWDCPLDPSQPGKWQNMVLYSRLSEGNPAAPLISNERGEANALNSFYVAKQRSDLMNAPIKAVMLPPGDPSGTVLLNGEPLPPLGYGARPVSTRPNGGCPANTELPAGMRWMKLWAFRADLPPRRYLAKGPTMTQLNRSVACNPSRYSPGGILLTGDCNPATPGVGPNSDCERNNIPGCKISNDIDTPVLAARLFQKDNTNPSCVIVEPRPRSVRTSSEFKDRWHREPVPGDNLRLPPALATVVALNGGNPLPSPVRDTPYPPFDVPSATSYVAFDSASSSDVVFVVTPPEVPDSSFTGTAAGDVNPDCGGGRNCLSYLPVRYRRVQDCQNADGSIKTSISACPDTENRKRIEYEPVLESLTRPNNADGSAPTTVARDFPICVPQDASL